MGFYTPDKGQLLIDDAEVKVGNPRDAQALGVGMVYQHFTLVPALTAAENLVDKPRQRALVHRLAQGAKGARRLP